MSVYTPIIQGIYTALPAAVRNSSQTIIGRTLIDPRAGDPIFGTAINPEASGIIAYLNITAAPGSETLTLILDEQDPVSGAWSSVASTSGTTVTGMVKLKLKQAIAAVAASGTGVQVQDTLPPIWRVRVAHSAGSNWTYSLGIVLYA